MALIELDTDVRTHPKHLRAGAEVCWLWAMAIGYAKQHLTDGFIPDEAVHTLGRFPSGWQKVVAIAVKERLLDQVDGGYRVHDFHAHNRRAEEIKKKKSKAAKRQREWRDKRVTNALHNAPDVDIGACDNDSDVTRDLLVSRDRARLVSESVSQKAVTGGEPERRGAPLIVSPLEFHKMHGKHAFCAGGLVVPCVPQMLHHEFRGLIGGLEHEAERTLIAWYESVAEAQETSGKSVSEPDAFRFWRGHYRDWRQVESEAVDSVPSVEQTRKYLAELDAIGRERDR